MRSNFTIILFIITFLLQFISQGDASAFSKVLEKNNNNNNNNKNENEKVLELPAGKIRGKLSEDKSYVSYLGLRYGEYEKRFEPSKLLDKLINKNNNTNDEDGVYDATDFGDMCPQLNRLMQKTGFSEDCLYLNVWAPNDNNTNANKQVMLFIHGGNYIQGSGNDPYVEGQEYAKKGIILVTINYRVGLFGFFAHEQLTKENPQNPTNFGLLDQIVAIKWVKKYISHFGGNPEDITVFGESAGANSIQWLMAHKDHATAPLFNRVILQSAPAASYPHDLKESEVIGAEFAEHAGCENDALECLRALSWDVFLSKVWTRRTFLLTVSPLPYSPTRLASPHVDYVNFLEHPAILGINGDGSSHNIIIGTTKHEWTLFIWATHLLMKPTEEWMHRSLELVFSSPHYHSSNFTDLVDRVERLYPREKYESGLDRVAAVYTDMVFTCPGRDYAKKLVAQGAKVYFYLFSHIAEHGVKSLKAYHASELPFVFQKRTPSFFGGLVKLFPTDFTPEEIELSNQMISLWVKLGKDQLKLQSGEEWPQYTTSKENYLEFALPLQVHKELYSEEVCQFWEEIAPGPQKAIIFDLMEHEPFLLKFVNEHTFSAIIFLVQKGRYILIAIVTLIAALLFRKCFLAGAPNKKKGDAKKKTN